MAYNTMKENVCEELLEHSAQSHGEMHSMHAVTPYQGSNIVTEECTLPGDKSALTEKVTHTMSSY